VLIYVEDTKKDAEVLGVLRPYVSEWILEKYGSLTPPQRMAIPYIKKGYNVLISSPTGTGKTLAAFLAIIDELFTLWERGELEDRVYVVYVSPLRALNNDMRRNLLVPLNEIRNKLMEQGHDVPDIRVAVRTSDTAPYEKQKMLRKPPHILITTPESLAVALVAPRFRKHLTKVRWVIVDEIHELASTKRGAHLSLSLERLEELQENYKELQRIGLSATIAPLDEVARFLVGYRDDGTPRNCVIVDARFTKPIDIRVVCPIVDIIHAAAEELNEAIYKALTNLISKHRTTLVFTNTRSATERVVYKLRKIFEKNNGIIDADSIEAHHSSLSRDLRLEVEEKLKKGELKAVVSSTSLELGIDIGYIDLVVLLSSPKSVSRLLQRIGRAGHHIKEVSKGRVIVVDRDDLVECTVLVKEAYHRHIDRVKIPKNPLDVLAQHLVGMSIEKRWKVEEAYRVVKRSYNFHELPFEKFITVLKYLSGKLVDLEFANIYAKIWYDEDEQMFGRRRGSRMIYYLNTGTIPDEAKIRVFLENGRYVGDLEESFVEILTPGDIFVLGGRTYQFIRSSGLRIIVRKVEGQRPTVPSWFSEMLPLAYDSALEVGKFRRIVAELIKTKTKEEVIEWLTNEYLLEKHAAEHIYNYIYEQLLYTRGIVPSDKLILIEIWFDPSTTTHNVIFHSLFGRRVNDVLSRAYAYVLGSKLRTNVRITVTDNGFMLTLPKYVELSLDIIRDAVGEVTDLNVEDIVKKALRRTELLKKRFRHCAERSFMILRRYKGEEISLAKRQLNAETLLRIVESIQGFPILEETYREILEDFMDLQHAKEVLSLIRHGELRIEIIRSFEVPSPFAHNIVAYGYSDIVLMEDRRKLLAKLHDLVLKVLAKRRSYKEVISGNSVQ